MRPHFLAKPLPYTVKKRLVIFPSAAGMSLGTGKLITFFYRVTGLHIPHPFQRLLFHPCRKQLVL
jgi:hypothetical protein